jgi:hypothetical protein
MLPAAVAAADDHGGGQCPDDRAVFLVGDQCDRFGYCPSESRGDGGR